MAIKDGKQLKEILDQYDDKTVHISMYDDEAMGESVTAPFSIDISQYWTWEDVKKLMTFSASIQKKFYNIIDPLSLAKVLQAGKKDSATGFNFSFWFANKGDPQRNEMLTQLIPQVGLLMLFAYFMHQQEQGTWKKAHYAKLEDFCEIVLFLKAWKDLSKIEYEAFFRARPVFRSLKDGEYMSFRRALANAILTGKLSPSIVNNLVDEWEKSCQKYADNEILQETLLKYHAELAAKKIVHTDMLAMMNYFLKQRRDLTDRCKSKLQDFLSIVAFAKAHRHKLKATVCIEFFSRLRYFHEVTHGTYVTLREELRSAFLCDPQAVEKFINSFESIDQSSDLYPVLLQCHKAMQSTISDLWAYFANKYLSWDPLCKRKFIDCCAVLDVVQQNISNTSNDWDAVFQTRPSFESLVSEDYIHCRQALHDALIIAPAEVEQELVKFTSALQNALVDLFGYFVNRSKIFDDSLGKKKFEDFRAIVEFMKRPLPYQNAREKIEEFFACRPLFLGITSNEYSKLRFMLRNALIAMPHLIKNMVGEFDHYLEQNSNKAVIVWKKEGYISFEDMGGFVSRSPSPSS